MKHKPHAVAYVLRSRAGPGEQDHAHPVERNRQPASDQDPLARILEHHSRSALPESSPAETNPERIYADDKPKASVWLYLLGIVTILYLFALMLILFG